MEIHQKTVEKLENPRIAGFRNFVFLAIILGGVLGMAKNSWATDWYVDKNASGSNNGTSWVNAWESFAQISGLSNGDTVYISGGDKTSKTYAETLYVVSSGITYRPGGASPSPIGHDGTVVITGPVDGSDQGIRILNNLDGVTINGNVDGNRKIRISVNSNRDGIYMDTDNTKNVKIAYIEFTTGYKNIRTSSLTGGEISYCYFYDKSNKSDSCITINATSPVFDQVIIHHNIFEMKGNSDGFGPDGINGVTGSTIYGNTFSVEKDGSYIGLQHQDAIQTGGYGYMKIHNNTFTGFSNYTLFMEYAKQSVWIWNNFFYKTRGPVICGGRGNDLDDFRIVNNTAVDCSVGGSTPDFSLAAGEYNGSGLRKITNSEIRNNIIINGWNGITQQAGSGYICGNDLVIDNNIVVAGSRGSKKVQCMGVDYTQPTYHSSVLPSFVNYIEDSGIYDMHLSSEDTIAKDHGTALNFFSTDILGTSRPQGSGWDIGAYEYIPSDDTTSPSVPSGLSVN